MLEPKGDPIHLHGVKVGELLISSEREGKDLVIKARLRDDWPGMWHASARSLDKEREQ